MTDFGKSNPLLLTDNQLVMLNAVDDFYRLNRYDPYHNAVAERINGILKEEFGFYGVFDSLEQAKELIEKSARIYNDKRPHWSNNLLTPNEMHQQRELKIKTWRKK